MNMPCGNTAAESQYANQQAKRAELGELLEPLAVEAIVDDLTTGMRYPRTGFPCIEIGDYYAEMMDEDDIARALTALTTDGAEERADMAFQIRHRHEAGLAEWLRAKHETFIERKVEELMEDD